MYIAVVPDGQGGWSHFSLPWIRRQILKTRAGRAETTTRYMCVGWRSTRKREGEVSRCLAVSKDGRWTAEGRSWTSHWCEVHVLHRLRGLAGPLGVSRLGPISATQSTSWRVFREKAAVLWGS